MEEHRNMMILKQEIFDSFIYSAVALTRQIQAKQGKEDEIITQEEADFVNAFLVYAKELADTLHERYKDELGGGSNV
ncbi:hypothetical protein P9C91_18090 [Bacillus licheniformis]|uniref:hypothetical protein n=1 Tax=Bacillus TaxID=1386 RepID=UPI00228270A9|nr:MULTISPECIES: hypothetical protein [Bacillus]MCY8047620.1 hypothetical protein [Bacillus haynesii]MDE1437633.1 hypothetical protein [Bacillus licheniformis]MEC0756461.1 hypothetical protein [Bacillus haynesii]MEC1243914.1 hypothetical protein [Bacillus licheniformis]MEC1326499.1 hypothetical protein [Bacillus licheniformis]